MSWKSEKNSSELWLLVFLPVSGKLFAKIYTNSVILPTAYYTFAWVPFIIWKYFQGTRNCGKFVELKKYLFIFFFSCIFALNLHARTMNEWKVLVVTRDHLSLSKKKKKKDFGIRSPLFCLWRGAQNICW